MHCFSPQTLECLIKAGWHEGRKVSLIKYRAYLTGEGYAWFSQVASFLAEFGDLQIRFDRHERISTLNLDACDASASFDSAWIIDDYAKRIGRTHFCVIGAAFTDHLLLFMDDAGNVYGGFDDFLCFVGSSGVDAIEAIFSNRKLPEIPESRLQNP